MNKVNSAARNADINNLATRMLKEFEKNDWSGDSYLSPILTELTTLNTDFTLALNRLTIYSQLAEQDEVRDEALRALFHLVSGYAYIPIDEIKDAAILVNRVLSQYGLSIQDEAYAAQSAKLDSLLVDLARPEITPAIEKLQGVADLIANLTAAQEEFERIALAQTEADAAKEQVSSASTLKKSVIVLINDELIDYMSVMGKVNPDTYASTAATIGQLIDQTNELTKRRSKKGEDEPVVPEEPEEEPS